MKKYEDMIDIMMDVPVKQLTTTVTVNNTEHTVTEERLYPICFGRDQLSAACYRGSIVIRHNSTIPSKRLEGLFPLPKTGILKLHY